MVPYKAQQELSPSLPTISLTQNRYLVVPQSKEGPKVNAGRCPHTVIDYIGKRSPEGQEGCCSYSLDEATDLVLGLKSWVGLLSRGVLVPHTVSPYNICELGHQPGNVRALSELGSQRPVRRSESFFPYIYSGLSIFFRFSHMRCLILQPLFSYNKVRKPINTKNSMPFFEGKAHSPLKGERVSSYTVLTLTFSSFHSFIHSLIFSLSLTYTHCLSMNQSSACSMGAN